MKRYLILALPLALAACAKPPQGDTITPPAVTTPAAEGVAAPADASALSAHHWRLSEAKNAQGQRIDALFVNADKPLQLDFKDGRVGVGNTCNRMNGAYSAEGDQLLFDRLASTMMACADPKLMALDEQVAARLSGKLQMKLQAGDSPSLALTTAGGDVLTFTGEPTAETRYGGPGETVFLEVAAQTKACSHPLIPDKQCLQVREIKFDDNGLRVGEPGEWQNFYDQIEGFSHQPGTRNVLRVNRYTVANPPADASSNAYVLDMVVESELVKR